eukprot:852523-Amphidinium_carterae.1
MKYVSRLPAAERLFKHSLWTITGQKLDADSLSLQKLRIFEFNSSSCRVSKNFRTMWGFPASCRNTCPIHYKTWHLPT